jgi:hypothetical protein
MKASVRPRVVTRDLSVIERSATGSGYDVERLIGERKVALDHVRVDGRFIRTDCAIDTIGAAERA